MDYFGSPECLRLGSVCAPCAPARPFGCTSRHRQGIQCLRFPFFLFCSLFLYQEYIQCLRFPGRHTIHQRFPGLQGELQGGVLDSFDLFGEEFSDSFRTKTRTKMFRTHKKTNIARNHGFNQVPEFVEINTTSLPELSKQLRDQNTSSE